jgi:curved DNA-binding protein CbpA
VKVAFVTNQPLDFYEVLQISPNAEPDTIQRVYRLLAQRFHPDNADTGDAERFREILDAYTVLSDPEARAQYDVVHHQCLKDRWRLAGAAGTSAGDRASEGRVRLSVLEILCARRRMEPNNPGLFPAELEKLLGVPQEHLEFSLWYLIQKRLIARSDSSRLIITVEGVDYLDEHAMQPAEPQRRLKAVSGS